MAQTGIFCNMFIYILIICKLLDKYHENNLSFRPIEKSKSNDCFQSIYWTKSLGSLV